jgi:hypothetical protein
MMQQSTYGPWAIKPFDRYNFDRFALRVLGWAIGDCNRVHSQKLLPLDCLLNHCQCLVFSVKTFIDRDRDSHQNNFGNGYRKWASKNC